MKRGLVTQNNQMNETIFGSGVARASSVHEFPSICSTIAKIETGAKKRSQTNKTTQTFLVYGFAQIFIVLLYRTIQAILFHPLQLCNSRYELSSVKCQKSKILVRKRLRKMCLKFSGPLQWFEVISTFLSSRFVTFFFKLLHDFVLSSPNYHALPPLSTFCWIKKSQEWTLWILLILLRQFQLIFSSTFSI